MVVNALHFVASLKQGIVDGLLFKLVKYLLSSLSYPGNLIYCIICRLVDEFIAYIRMFKIAGYNLKQKQILKNMNGVFEIALTRVNLLKIHNGATSVNSLFVFLFIKFALLLSLY